MPLPLTLSWEIYEFFRSSHRSCIMKKAVLKNFVIFTGKLQARNFIKNRLQHQWFPLSIAKFLKTAISKNICSVSCCLCIDYFIKVRRVKSNATWTTKSTTSSHYFSKKFKTNTLEVHKKIFELEINNLRIQILATKMT